MFLYFIFHHINNQLSTNHIYYVHYLLFFGFTRLSPVHTDIGVKSENIKTNYYERAYC